MLLDHTKRLAEQLKNVCNDQELLKNDFLDKVQENEKFINQLVSEIKIKLIKNN
jgi:hypothetical protein